MIEGNSTRAVGTELCSRILAPVMVLALALALGACSSSKARFDSGLPGMTTPMVVQAVSSRGPYLEAKLQLEGRDLEAYALPSDECHAVFQVSEAVQQVASGAQGEYRRDEHRCRGLGFGNLELWRDRNRRASKAGVPRGQASYRILHSDDEVALLRGQFPLASYLGFGGASDVVAVVPRTPECEGPIEKGVASMEYRGKGQRALSLVGSTKLCQIRGLILPPPQATPAR